MNYTCEQTFQPLLHVAVIRQLIAVVEEENGLLQNGNGFNSAACTHTHTIMGPSPL